MLPDELLEECYQVARYNAQSRNIYDQRDQKNLWIKMHEHTNGYDSSGFRVYGLSHPSLQHHDNMTAKCLQYLQKASDPVHPAHGAWRLWEDPLFIPKASETYADRAPAPTNPPSSTCELAAD